MKEVLNAIFHTCILLFIILYAIFLLISSLFGDIPIYDVLIFTMVGYLYTDKVMSDYLKGDK